MQPSSFEIARRPISKLLTIRRDGALATYHFSGIVLCFGGGVLISTVFIHMLGEVCRMYLFEEDENIFETKKVRESLERASNMGMMPSALLELEYPFAELLLCVGFLFILLIESVVHKMFGGAGQHGHLQLQYMMTDCVQVTATLMEEDWRRWSLTRRSPAPRSRFPGCDNIIILTFSP